MTDASDTHCPRLSVVIPTYNRSDLIVQCVASLQDQRNIDFEIVVVDDGGSDDTNEALARDFPNVRVIRRASNGGFAKAVNTGIEAAQGEYIFLLNNDMTLAPDCLSQLAAAADDGDAAILGPLVLMAHDHGLIYSAGDRIRANGRPESIGFRERLDDFDFSEPVFGITAGAALYKRAVFNAIGYFDETFIAYFEDADLCFRARLAGFTCALIRDAIVYHRGSASIDSRLWWRTRQCFRNHALLILKNFPFALMTRHCPAIVGERLRGVARTFSAVRCDRGAIDALAELGRVGREVVLLMPRTLRARRVIQRKRVVSASDVERWLTP